MAKRLLDFDSLTGVATYHHYDHHTKQTIIEEVQDVSPFIERNKQAQINDTKQGIKENWWHVASIPIGVQYQWMKEHGVNIWDKNHKKAMFKLLNDPDYRYLKTTTGKIGNG